MEYQNLIGQINKNLYAATERMATWLFRSFKKNPNYWRDCVLAKLSDNQRAIIEQKGFSELADLDLAALLRITERNWYLLTNTYSDLGNSEREVVRSITGIRNRWAHLGTQAHSNEQILQDLHSLRDFFKIINIDADAKTTIRELIRNVTSGECIEDCRTPAVSLQTEPMPQTVLATIEQNSIVRLKHDPLKTGVIMTITPIGDTIKYGVFVDGKIEQRFADQIELMQQTNEDEKASLNDLLRIMTARQLCPPSSTNLFSLNSAKIDFVPYQFRPALKIIKSETPRLLIADGVGVGKTIEAGLIIKELAARSPLETIIIICPRPLVAEKKWEKEMRDKFGEDFVPADKGLLRQLIKDYERDGKWDERYNRLIIPYSILTEDLLTGVKGKRAHCGLENLYPPPFFDMLIVDEAHHVRNSSTNKHKVVKFFTEHSNAVLFLSATPIQLGNNDLFTLLNMLFPDYIMDKAVFHEMAEPNQYINAVVKFLRAGAGHETEARDALSAVESTEWGRKTIMKDPTYKKLQEALSHGELSREQRVTLIGEAESLHSFAYAINRTRRQDIEDFCVRRAHTLKSVFAPKQQELHDELLAFVAAINSRMNPNISLKFLMSTIRRQAASCIFGLAPFIRDIVAKKLTQVSGEDIDELQDSDEELDFGKVDFATLGQLAARVIQLAETLPPDDPKFDTLATILKERDKLSNGKTMLFSTFRHTLRYLKTRIKKDLGLRVELVDGSVKDEDRYSLRERFELPKNNPNAIDILLFSEVGSEGLDYQFCDALVNYDLPWNPMRIEQRIGRIDRRGQKSETVQIFNCITRGTIDYEIHERCYNRIDIFEKSLGECSEILGNMEESLANIIFDPNLTEQERIAKMEKLADNAVLRIEEDRRLEDEGKEMLGLDLVSYSDDIEKADSQWLSQTAIKRMINGYLSERLGGRVDFLTDSGLSLSIEEKAILFDEYNRLDGKHIDKIWERYLKSSKPNCHITLSSSDATKNKKYIFLTLLHPLVRQAANYYSGGALLKITLSFVGEEIPKGEYPFSLYAWEYKGFRPHTEYVLICENDTIYAELLAALPNMVSVQTNIQDHSEVLNTQEARHLSKWKAARETFFADVTANCNYKIASLERNIKTLIKRAEGQLAINQNEKIEVMLKSQIRRLEIDFEVKKARHQKAIEQADLIATLIASGTIIAE